MTSRGRGGLRDAPCLWQGRTSRAPASGTAHRPDQAHADAADGPGGFSIDDLTIDLAARTATCPAGHNVLRNPTGDANFGPRCRACPVRARCTRKGRFSNTYIADVDGGLLGVVVLEHVDGLADDLLLSGFRLTCRPEERSLRPSTPNSS